MQVSCGLRITNVYLLPPLILEDNVPLSVTPAFYRQASCHILGELPENARLLNALDAAPKMRISGCKLYVQIPLPTLTQLPLCSQTKWVGSELKVQLAATASYFSISMSGQEVDVRTTCRKPFCMGA